MSYETAKLVALIVFGGIVGMITKDIGDVILAAMLFNIYLRLGEIKRKL